MGISGFTSPRAGDSAAENPPELEFVTRDPIMRCWTSLAITAALLLSGCSSNNNLVGNPNLTVVAASALPPPARVDLSSPTRPYFIAPGDQVSIDVFGAPDVTRSVTVDSDGRIALPLAGVVQAGGKTLDELAATITQALRGGYIRNPQVTVNIAAAQGQTVTVDGEVSEPGIYPIAGRATLVRTIARAKGATEFASLSHVVVFRSVNGQSMAALYDLRAIRNGLYADPEVYPNDVIVVGSSQARRLFRDIVQGSGLLVAPIIALIQRN
jgi:polysaccharide export outer membrane protein